MMRNDRQVVDVHGLAGVAKLNDCNVSNRLADSQLKLERRDSSEENGLTRRSKRKHQLRHDARARLSRDVRSLSVLMLGGLSISGDFSEASQSEERRDGSNRV